ncbi:murein DD-endopeptidase MepM/ murein hydrolase activator NlpD [Microbacteriaceae bacterium SG_E_30_P1]|uniref:Murein DD-endopeptidase MepM/ murein hydrolase activator NlpD n=1 Tax=Antiquaquibacter oligotrophicus TaxID=2880260 RepID=A0ABT6KMR8_9MICO|nr:M23 family metallopeptidase [Antiquaquibacter oligotrophicus]MDH6181312.1 murein DD-endopeptidase MepM/ murein hydrolase activator NlpD [Antiquaquibacter oligotrophicus]UDF12995.1 M23 family metallopeptidase [Antiquaquibacter oligotrophicus]
MPQYRRSTRALHRRQVSPYVGLLSLNKRSRALAALACAYAFMSIPALPASATPVALETRAPGQAFLAQAYLPVPAVRDGFGVTEFSLVQWPVPANTTMTSDYGYRNCAGCSSDHKGIDLTPGDGYPIESVADGIVVEAAEDSGGLGVHVVVEHNIDGQVVRTVYAHMRYGSIAHSAGETVARGDQLGLVGNTGASTGSHLHFEVIVDDVQINPLTWLLEHANS